MFDKDEFFASSIFEEGYFDYEKDGFGPVCCDYESSVEKLVELIENDCKISEKYLNRINDFYEFDDKNNCQRIFDAIKE